MSAMQIALTCLLFLGFGLVIIFSAALRPQPHCKDTDPARCCLGKKQNGLASLSHVSYPNVSEVSAPFLDWREPVFKLGACSAVRSRQSNDQSCKIPLSS